MFGFGDRLGLRLVVASLIVGSVLSVFTTGLQLSSSFLRQRSDATQVLDRIDRTMTTSLEQAVWTFNFPQVDIILDGLFADPNVAFVRLTTSTGQAWERGTPVSSDLERAYDLIHFFDDMREEKVGELQVSLSLEVIRERVWAQLWTILLSNLAKAYLAALALLFIVHRMITRHLRRIAHHVDDNAPLNEKPALVLSRQGHDGQDDLDRIVEAVDRFEDRTRQQMDALRAEIAERERAEAEARKALSIRSNFLATMSHEIRTPLNAIMGLLHLMTTHDEVGIKPRAYAETANRAAHQLMAMLNNTLDMSRIEADAIDIRRTPTSLHDIAAQWQEAAQATLDMRNKSIDVTLDIDPALPGRAMLDGPHLTQIVTNLVDNAVKFTDTGRVHISLEAMGPAPSPGLAIRVCDTGTGIPPEARSEIFERFAQAQQGMGRVHGGAGLGLAISRELAEMMDATLELEESDRDGFTTSFLLKLNSLRRLDIAS